jgi:cytochrome c peroxidase
MSVRLILVGFLLLTPAFAPRLGAVDPPPDVTPQEAIGWKLFFDPILSRPKNISCASCHLPEKGFEGGEAFGKGAHGDVLPRNTPTVVNLKDATSFFWDGRAESLEQQAEGPITNPIEMDLPLEEVVARVRQEPHYQSAFAALGVDEITVDDITAAIAAFERRLVTGEAAYDHWLAGNRDALTPAQEGGRMIFFTTGQCALCHMGPNFTDGDFHNVGTGSEKDPGRYLVTKNEEDKGAFKPPSLRNWKGREPFMHDGRFATMREVIEHYNEPESKLGESELDPLDLSEEEINDLLSFMEALNGPWPDLKPFEESWRKLAGK